MKNRYYILIAINIVLIAMFSMIWLTKSNNKNKWYIEITNDFINIRTDHTIYSEKIGMVEKGETYEVLDMYLDDTKYYWYYIEIDNFNKGWVASDKVAPYLNDFNNPNDLVAPVVKYYEDIYSTYSINTITYDHLEITEENEYSIDNEVFYDEVGNQYFIKYFVVDASGNKTTKTQKIAFEVEPSLEG